MVFFKKKLRQVMLEKRSAVSKAEVAEKSAKILSALFASPEFQRAKSILFYASFGNEVETHSAIEKAISLGKRVCLPRVGKEKGELELYEVKSLGGLAPGAFGILEPVPEESVRVSPDELGLIIVPGVAFTEAGTRLGYGMGFYDKLLKKAACPNIALAFELQIIPDIPAGPGDVRVACILTEERKIGCE